jgi:MFS family permease
MIAGYMFVFAITNALARDYTPVRDAGKLQGVRMTFSVLLPMIFGPMIGNAVNKAQALPLPDAGADIMTTQYIPAPEIFLAGAIVACLLIGCVWLLCKAGDKKENA